MALFDYFDDKGNLINAPVAATPPPSPPTTSPQYDYFDDRGRPTAAPVEPPAQPLTKIEADRAATRAAVDKAAAEQGIQVDTEAPLGGDKLAEFGRGLVRGTMSTLPKAAGSLLSWEGGFNRPDVGEPIKARADQWLKDHPEYRESQAAQVGHNDWLNLNAGVASAGENLPMSSLPWVAGAAGAAIGSLGGPGGTLLGARIGATVGSLASLPLFYAQQGEQSAEAIYKGQKEAGASDEQAKAAALTGGKISGGIESGGELLADAIPLAWMFKPFMRVGKAAEGGLVKQFLSPMQMAKRAALAMAETQVGEVGTEMAQQAGEAQTEKAFGSGGPGATWQDTASVIIPTALMTLLPGGLVTAHNFRTMHNVRQALTDPEVPEDRRAAAAALVFHGVSADNPQVGQAFDLYAANQIAKGLAINVSDDQTYTKFYNSTLTKLMYGDEQDIAVIPPGIRAKAMGIDPEGPMGAIASAALDAKALGAVNAARTMPLQAVNDQAAFDAAKLAHPDLSDEEIHALLRKETFDQAQAEEEGAGVPPVNPDTAMPRFATPEQAQTVAVGLSMRTGEPYAVIPHPTAHDSYAVVTKAQADQIQGQQRGPEVAPVPPPSTVKPAAEGEDHAVEVGPTGPVGPQPGGQEGTGRGGQGEGVGPSHPGGESGGDQGVGPTTGVERPGGEPTPAAGEGKAGGEVVGGPRTPGGPALPPIVPGTVDVGAHTGATSPHTPDSEPSPAQKEAENYKVGEPVTLQGQTMRVENAQGSQRSNLDTTELGKTVAALDEKTAAHPELERPTARLSQAIDAARRGDYAAALKIMGQVVPAIAKAGPEVGTEVAFLRKSVREAWASVMQAHYARILGTKGNDGDHLDAFIKPGTPLDHDGPIFVIDQRNTATGAFDEHKLMYGYGSRFEAVKAYKAHYPKGWGGFIGITQATAQEVNDWAKNGDTSKPFADRSTGLPAPVGGAIAPAEDALSRTYTWNDKWPSGAQMPGPPSGSTGHQIAQAILDRLWQARNDFKTLGHATGTWFEMGRAGKEAEAFGRTGPRLDVVYIQHNATGFAVQVPYDTFMAAKSKDDLAGQVLVEPPKEAAGPKEVEGEPVTPPVIGGPRTPEGPETPRGEPQPPPAPQPTPPEGEPPTGPVTPPAGPETPTPPTGEGKAPKPPKPPGEKVTIAQAKKVWAEMLPSMPDEAPLYENATWRVLDGAPHVIGKEGAVHHFVREDSTIQAREGWVSDKARRRATAGKETEAEDKIADMIADGDRQGLTEAIYEPLGVKPQPAQWVTILPENLIRLPVTLEQQAAIEASLKALKFRITDRITTTVDNAPGALTLSAIYRPPKDTITDVGAQLEGGRKGTPIDVGEPTDPDTVKIEKLMESIAKRILLDPRMDHGSFGSFMAREALFEAVWHPLPLIGKRFESWQTRGKPKAALTEAVKAGRMDQIVGMAERYRERLVRLMEVVNDAENVGDLVAALRNEYLETGWKELNAQGEELKLVIPDRDIPGLFTSLLNTYAPNEDSTDQTNRAVKKDPDVPPRLERIVRVDMKDHRGGKNIDAEDDFAKTFGFRGVEFGNWVNQIERQENLNLAYDGLLDLVDMLSAPPTLVGLGENLGLAFGARGRGRASAHFEPSNNVINLTRHKGNGTVSHEWMHAFEHALRRSTSYNQGLSDDLRAVLKQRIDATKLDAKVRAVLKKEAGQLSNRNVPPKEAAMNYLLGEDDDWIGGDYDQRITDTTTYYDNASAIDAKAGKAYWATPHELVARGFESFIYDATKGGSPYLVGPTVADGYVTPANGYIGTTYPRGDERAYVAAQYKAMLEQIDLATLEAKTFKVDPVIRVDPLGKFHVYDQFWMRLSERALDTKEAAEHLAERFRDRIEVRTPRTIQMGEAYKQAWELAERVPQIMEELGIHDYPEVKNGSMAESMFYHMRNGWWPENNAALIEFTKKAYRIDALDRLKQKQAQEDFEAALAKYAGQRITDAQRQGANPRAVYDLLLELYNKSPNLDIQTSTSLTNQGYSTPLPIAWIGNLLLRLQASTTLADVTGGNGLLTIGANPQNVVMNELEVHRAQNLRLMQYGTVHEGNALTLMERGLLKPEQVDAMIFNPPFGALPQEQEVDGYKMRAIDHLIVAKNLAAMRPDGRAVLILGANMKPGVLATKDRIFLNWLYSNYNVSDHFEVDGGLYKRMGASWPLRIIVIAGRQLSDKISPESGTIDRVSTFDELWDRYVQADARSQQILVGSVRAPEAPRGPDQQPGGVPGGDRGQDRGATGEGGGGRGGSGTGGFGGLGGIFGPPSTGSTGGGAPRGRPGGRAPASGRPGNLGPGSGERGAGSGEGSGEPTNLGPRGVDTELSDLSDDDLDAILGESRTPPPEPSPPAAPRRRKGKITGGSAEAGAITRMGTGPTVAAMPEFVLPSFSEVAAQLGAKTLPVGVPRNWRGVAEVLVKARPFFDFMHIDPQNGRWNLDAEHTLHFAFFGERPEGKAAFLPAGSQVEWLQLFGVRRNDGTFLPIEQGLYQIGAAQLGLARAELPGPAGFGALADVKFSEDLDPSIKRQVWPAFQEEWNKLRARIKEIAAVIREFWAKGIRALGEMAKPYLRAFINEKRQQEIDKKNRKGKEAIVDDEVDNSLQVVYESRSKNGNEASRGIFVSREQATALQTAFDILEAKYAADYPDGVDEMVQKELGYDTREALYDALAGYQIDAMALAIDKMRTGDGFIIGDDTGVGKGRVGAALVLWAVRQGKIPVFMTEKADLYSDFYRDLVNIGHPELKWVMSNTDSIVEDADGDTVKKATAAESVAIADHIIAHGTLPGDAQALLTNYSQYQGPDAAKRRDALRKLVASNKVMFIMDESHNASGASGVGAFMQQMLTGTNMQGLPGDWVPPSTVYLSATFAKRADNMPIYVRTHIRYIGKTPEERQMIFNSGGWLLQQVVSEMLVRSGQMIRRERSYANINVGQAVDTDHSARDARLVDDITDVLRQIVNADRAFIEALRDRDFVNDFIVPLLPPGATVGGSTSQIVSAMKKNPYTSVVHNALGQLMLAAKVDFTVRKAVEAMNRGEKPVIALSNTMEAMLSDPITGYAKLAGIKLGDPLPNFGWRSVAERALNGTLRISFTPPMGGAKIRFTVPESILPPMIRQEYQKAHEKINALNSPLSAAPIDKIRFELSKYVIWRDKDGRHVTLPDAVPAGTEFRHVVVDEVTARSSRVDYSTPVPTYVSRSKKGKVGIIRRFNMGEAASEGPIDVLIANVSGATGISLHAGYDLTRFADQSKRHMLILQPAPNISIFKQMLGRINRTMQVERPLYTMLSSSVPAEKRPFAMLRRKMKILTSNTSAGSKAATDVDSTVDFLNIYGNAVVASYLREHESVRQFLDVDVPASDDDLDEDLAMIASGRAALLTVADQELFYENIERNYLSDLEERNKSGTNRLDRSHYPFDAVAEEENIFTEGDDNSDDAPLRNDSIITQYDVQVLGAPPTPDSVRKAIAASLNGRTPGQVIDQIEADLTMTYEQANDELARKITEAQTKLGQIPGIPGEQLTAKQQEALTDKLAALKIELNRFGERKDNTLRALRQAYAIGMGGLMRFNDMESFATVVGITVHKAVAKAGNPYSPSNFKLQFLRNIPDGYLSLNLARIEKLTNIRAGYWKTTPDLDYEYRDRNVTGGREKRYIITRNIPAALERTQGVGEIMTFDIRGGDPEKPTQGLLMARSFSPGNLALQDYFVRDPKQITDFLLAVVHASLLRSGNYSAKAEALAALRGSDTSITLPVGTQTYAFSAFTRGRAIQLVPDDYGDVDLVLDGDKAKRFVKNKTVIDLIGDLGGKRGGSFRKTVPYDKLLPLVRFLQSQSPFYVSNSIADYVKPFAPGGQPKASLALGGTMGVPIADVLAHVRGLASRWVNHPDIEVVQHAADLPFQDNPKLKALVERGGRLRGLIDRSGKIWLVADNLGGPADIEFTLLHELMGHFGLHALLGEKLDATMESIYYGNATVRAAARDGLARGYSVALATEEAIADMAGAGGLPKLPFWRRLLAAIRNAIHNMGFGHKVSDAQVLQLLADARQMVEAGVARSTGLEARASFAELTANATNYLTDTFARSPNTFAPALKWVQTQQSKARSNALYDRVFRATQAYIRDVAAMANDAADEAGNQILPRLGTISEAFQGNNPVKVIQLRRDMQVAAQAMMLATIADVRLTRAQMLSGSSFPTLQHGVIDIPALTEAQADLFEHARDAVELSLHQLTTSEMARVARGDYTNEAAIERAKADPRNGYSILEAELNTALAEAVQHQDKEAEVRIAAKMKRLQELEARRAKLFEEGYAPLMRFGKYSLRVARFENGKVAEELYFGLYESKHAMYQAERDMREDPQFQQPGVQIITGTMTEDQWKLYRGLSMDSLAVFAQQTGVDQDAAFQAYYDLAVASRSALKRLIHRKGIAGYSEDLPRILSGFITSNARLAARNYHFGEMAKAAQDIPNELGQLRTEANRLVSYVQNPMEEAHAARGLLFVHFIGGSIASALVNLTQPVMMTLPYLSGESNPAIAAAAFARATKALATGNLDPSTRAALDRAGKEGVTDPQELHQLYAESIRGLGSNIWLRKFLRLWGAPFSLAETYNRRVTFVAALDIASQPGMLQKINDRRAVAGRQPFADAFAFAEDAVEWTQGIYNRGNRPNFSRGPVGALVGTFKQYTIHYLEFLAKLPPREKAIAAALLIAAAGVQGLPGADALEDLIDTIGQWAGFNTNSKAALRRLAINLLGQTAGQFALHGLSGIPGVPFDVSARLAVNNIIPGSALFKRSEVDKAAQLAEISGPVGGVYNQVQRGVAALQQGLYGQAAVTSAPIAVGNMMRALDMWQTGQARDYLGRKITDVSKMDAAFKAIGIQPKSVAIANELDIAVRQDLAMVRLVEAEIAEKWARGILENDQQMVRNAVVEMMNWNRLNPQWTIRINAQQIQQRVREAMMERSMRIGKTAPREVRGTVFEELRRTGS